MLRIRSIESTNAHRVNSRCTRFGAIEFEAKNVDAGTPFGGHGVPIAAQAQSQSLYMFIVNINRHYFCAGRRCYLDI